MRLFIAIDISDDTRAQVRRVREALRAQLARGSKAPRVTWVRDEAAHVTLRFIGEVADDVGAKIEAALREPLAQWPFEMVWKGVGTFPGGRGPRVVWIGVEKGNGDAAALADAVNERLLPIVGSPEPRPFTAHLTVGRVKDFSGRFDWPRALAAVDAGSSRGVVDHITLYRSRTTPQGPSYTALVTTPLVG